MSAAREGAAGIRVHPDGGSRMLERPIANAKIAALVPGRDLYVGHGLV